MRVAKDGKCFKVIKYKTFQIIHDPSVPRVKKSSVLGATLTLLSGRTPNLYKFKHCSVFLHIGVDTDTCKH